MGYPISIHFFLFLLETFPECFTASPVVFMPLNRDVCDPHKMKKLLTGM